MVRELDALLVLEVEHVLLELAREALGVRGVRRARVLEVPLAPLEVLRVAVDLRQRLALRRGARVPRTFQLAEPVLVDVLRSPRQPLVLAQRLRRLRVVGGAGAGGAVVDAARDVAPDPLEELGDVGRDLLGRVPALARELDGDGLRGLGDVVLKVHAVVHAVERVEDVDADGAVAERADGLRRRPHAEPRRRRPRQGPVRPTGDG